jgi:hypothetical protein
VLVIAGSQARIVLDYTVPIENPRAAEVPKPVQPVSDVPVAVTREALAPPAEKPPIDKVAEPPIDKVAEPPVDKVAEPPAVP